MLLENLQLADKYFFKTNKLNLADKEQILEWTNGDAYTFKIAEAYYHSKVYAFKNEQINNNFLKYLHSFYIHLKNYNPQVLPLVDYVIEKPSKDILNFMGYITTRAHYVEQLQNLPSVFIRNIKQLITKPRASRYDLDSDFQDLSGIVRAYKKISQELAPEDLSLYNKKAFTSKSDSLYDVMEKMQSVYAYFLDVKEPYNTVLKKAKQFGVEVIQAENIKDVRKLIVLKIDSPEEMREMGCGALWCIVTDAYHYWDTYTQWTGSAFLIFDYNASANEYFKMVYCENDSQTEKEVRENGVMFNLFDASNNSMGDGDVLESIGVDMGKIESIIENQLVINYPKIKDNPVQKIRKVHYDPSQLHLPFQEPEYQQVAELRKRIHGILLESLLG